jgi:signal transduction histidine kinase
VDDFYTEMQQHPEALKVITGGPEQIDRLKRTLLGWLRDLFSGCYDEDYVARRWKIGHRHVEIGLDQFYVNVALSRLRRGLTRAIAPEWQGSVEERFSAQVTLNTLIDLDLALIEDAYQTEFNLRQQAVERLALIGRVAAGVAHELRNPLNVIKTSVFYLMTAKNPSQEKVTKHLNRIEQHVGRADGVISTLTSFAKLPLPNLQPVCVESLLQETLEELERPDGVEFSLEFADELRSALADVAQLQIVLSNLIRNACEAMHGRGRLTFSAQNGTSREGREHVEIAVSDTGDGIHPDHVQRIMEPFFTTKARGIGLGLAMAKAIVDKNEGSLTVESQPGQGTTFTIRLQAALESV